MKNKNIKNNIKSYSTSDHLNKLDSDGRGLYTSIGENFNNATFGRDSLISSEILFDWDSNIAKETILTLASLQGVKDRRISGEQVGKIHHENRNFETWDASPVKKVAFESIAHLWGADFEKMTTYFSMDSTPLYISLVSEYVKRDPTILDEKIIRSNGDHNTVLESVTEAINLTIDSVNKSGLIESDRHNPFSIIHQTWKDSPTSYIHDNGEMANITDNISYLDIQYLTLECLKESSVILEYTNIIDVSRVENAIELINNATINKFWIENEGFFTSAIDIDNNGDERQLKVSQSDQGHLLNSSIFDKLPEKNKEKYISSIVCELFSDNFLTDAGIRCRSLENADSLNFVDYHGSGVSWPIDTFIISEGLRRQGFSKLAEQLDNRILNTVNQSGDGYEFYYINPDGTILLHPEDAKEKHNGARNLDVQMYPESNIAWTVSAIHAIKLRNGTKKFKQKTTKLNSIPDWANDLQDSILANIKHINVYKTLEDIQSHTPEQVDIYLNTLNGNTKTIKYMTNQILGQYVKKSNKKNKSAYSRILSK